MKTSLYAFVRGGVGCTLNYPKEGQINMLTMRDTAPQSPSVSVSVVNRKNNI